MVSCPTCDVGTLSAVAEFPVTVGDPDGSGGVVEEVRTTAVNRSRGISLGANVRPNSQFSYPTTSVPARGSLQLSAGLVITPPPSSTGRGQRDSLRPAHRWAHGNRVGAARRDRRVDGVSLGATFTSQAAGACARRARSPGHSPVAGRPLLPRRCPPATDRPPPAAASRRPQTASSTTPA